MGARALPRLGLQAAHARGHRALADDGHKPDVAGARHMRAPAQLNRIGLARKRAAAVCAHADNAHLVAIFLAEQRARARFSGILDTHQPRGHPRVLDHQRVGNVFHLRQLRVADRLWMGKVEAQPFGRNQRPLLRDMVTQHLAQRLVQEMRGRMVGADGGAPRGVHVQLNRVARFERSCLDDALMHNQVTQLFLRVGHAQACRTRLYHTRVTHLAAGLAIERRLVDDDAATFAKRQRSNFLAALHQRSDNALGALGVIAQKFRRPGFLLQRIPDGFGRRLARSSPGLARLGPLALHGGGEGVEVNADAARAQCVLRQIEREAVGIVKFERGFARQVCAAGKSPGLLVQNGKATHQRGAEARFLQLQRLGDQRLRAQKLGVGLAHLARQCGHQPPHQRVARAKQLGVAHGAAHDAAQHIAAALIRGQHTVRHQKRRGAQMIGDDAVRGGLRAARIDAGLLGHSADQRLHHVGVVIAGDALHDGGDALQPHAGVDRRARQAQPLARPDLLELHEHEVPEFQKAVAVLVGAAWRAAEHCVALVIKNLGAWSTGAGVAHRPEIVRGGDADDARLRQARDLAPQRMRLVILGIYGHPQPVLVEAKIFGDQAPGQLNGARLKIVAEGKIAEHLKKCVVARRVADVIKVIVLAARAYNFLRRGGARIGALFETRKNILELHHTRIGKHQGGVIARHKRARGDDFMIVLVEIIQERRPDFINAAHLGNSFFRQTKGPDCGPSLAVLAAGDLPVE